MTLMVVLAPCQLVSQELRHTHVLVFATTLILAVVVLYELNLLRDKIWHH
jgi:hypothetical protein